MDFEYCKENIQPLRGGRNRDQLQTALLAQADRELQKELLQNKQAFEHTISTYEGDDPLDNWYNYISWVEQSYPKHGHEGNLIPLLEDCLEKFENDERYFHDRRFCRLWIKYIDLQQNPDELFQLLHSKGICISCADLYRAWAFFHEIVGNFKRANAVYQLGLDAWAQPEEDLLLAQNNMFMAAGRQMVEEEHYEERLHEQRKALTSLRTYKHKHHKMVPSVRVNNQARRLTPNILPSTVKKNNENNKMVSVYVDENGESLTGAVGGFKSILDAARRQNITKENTLKPGRWTVVKMKKTSCSLPQTPSFKIHEDESSSRNSIVESLEHIKLSSNFVPTNSDDFTNWKIDMFVAEPDDPKKIPMYPKHKVYCNNKEFSLEEIIAGKYLTKISHQKSMLNKVLTENQKVKIMDSKPLIKSILKLRENPFKCLEDNEPSCNNQTTQSKISHNICEKPLETTNENETGSKVLFSEAEKTDLVADNSTKKLFKIYCEDDSRSSKKTSNKPYFEIYDETVQKNEKTINSAVCKSSGAIKKQFTSKKSKNKLFQVYSDQNHKAIDLKKHKAKDEETNCFEIFDDENSKNKLSFQVYSDQNDKPDLMKHKEEDEGNTHFQVFEDGDSKNKLLFQDYSDQGDKPLELKKRREIGKGTNQFEIFDEGESKHKLSFQVYSDQGDKLLELKKHRNIDKETNHFEVFEDGDSKNKLSLQLYSDQNDERSNLKKCNEKDKRRNHFAVFEDEDSKNKLSFQVYTDQNHNPPDLKKQRENEKGINHFEIFEDKSLQSDEVLKYNSHDNASSNFSSTFEGSLYREKNGLLSKDSNFSFSRDKTQKNNTEEFKEHVRSLLKMHPANDSVKEIVKLNRNLH